MKGGLLCSNVYCRQQACFLYVSLSNERHGIWVKIIKNIKQNHGKSLLHLALYPNISMKTLHGILFKFPELLTKRIY